MAARCQRGKETAWQLAVLVLRLETAASLVTVKVYGVTLSDF